MKTVKLTQNQILEKFLRGTSRTLTEEQARARFGIQNLRARISELRCAGLDVRTAETKTTGKAQYSIPARTVYGSRAKIFV